MPAMDVSVPADLAPFAAQALAAVELGKARLLAALEGLTPEQLATAPAGFSNSIAALLVHLSGTEVGMAHALLGRSLPDDLRAEYLRDRPQNPIPQPVGETLATLTAKREKALAILRQAVAGLRPEDAGREVQLFGDRTATVRWVLTILGNHQMQHFGQIQMIKKFL